MSIWFFQILANYVIFIKNSMNNSFTKSILNPSLELIRNDYKIKKFYFFPGILSVIFISVLLVYQVVYTYSVLLWKKDAVFDVLLNIFHSQYISQALIAAGIFVVCYIILIPIFEWGLIRYIDKASSWEASRSDSLWHGIMRFAPLFEFNNIFNMFKFMSIVNGFLFAIRFLGVEYISLLCMIFTIAFLFSIVLNILTAYARYEIVLENKWVFEAIGVSSQIALLNIKTTLKLYVLMFIMNIKVIFNFIIFLIFPLLSAFIIGFVSSQTFLTITFIVLWIIFMFLLLILWYMAAVLEVFTTSIWYNAYLEWKKKLNDSNV